MPGRPANGLGMLAKAVSDSVKLKYFLKAA
jgi:hypothetical protein